MTENSHVRHVPKITGGTGYSGVRGFYKDHFEGKMQGNTRITNISRTVGKCQVVGEIVKFYTRHGD